MRPGIRGGSALPAAAALGGCEAGRTPIGPGDPASLTGVWRAANGGNRLWGDSIVLTLTQTDTALAGRYEARGAAGRGTDGGSYGGAASRARSTTSCTAGRRRSRASPAEKRNARAARRQRSAGTRTTISSVSSGRSRPIHRPSLPG